MDAARLLPVVGAFLFFLPVLWAGTDAPGAETAREAVYIFTVWGLLIVAAFFLSRRLVQTVEGADPATPDAAMPSGPTPPDAALGSAAQSVAAPTWPSPPAAPKTGPTPATPPQDLP